MEDDKEEHVSNGPPVGEEEKPSPPPPTVKLVKVGRPSSGTRIRSPKLIREAMDAEDAMYFSPLDSSVWMFSIGLVVIILASVGTRLHKISEPHHVA